MAEGPFFGKAEAAHAYTHPGTLDYAADQIDESLFGYDPEKAAKILDDAGWKMGSDGFRCTIH